MTWKPLYASILGLLAHQLVFIRGEWHLQAPVLLLLHILLAIIFVGAEVQLDPLGGGSTTESLICIICYLISLFASISIYRLYFHRLHNFPGPRLAVLSKLWHVWQCRDSRNHLLLERLHREYGPYVRSGMENLVVKDLSSPLNSSLGPNEITIFHPAVFEAIDGPGNNTTRSDWYDLIYPRQSSIFTRDRRLHDGRRQIWLHSLSTKGEHQGLK